MLREKLFHHEPVDGFRWRSHEITRVEGFSDAVFGFAITLLIVSLEVPKTSTELLATMRGFSAFVVTFMILAGLWYAQHTFFRRYGLEDRVTVILNLVLLFTVLFFVYPLKFLFSMLLTDPQMKGTIHTEHGLEPVVLAAHKPWLFVIFALGFIAVFTVFFLLFRHAYKQREALGLNEFELYETEHSMRRMKLSIAVGVMYFAVAFLNSMPHRTKSEKITFLTVAIVIVIFFLGMMVQMLRLARERKRVAKEWKERGNSSDTPHV
jgi:low temperature requirement protein LtrA